METNHIILPPQSPAQDARQNSVVTIPVERYAELIEKETRLCLLRKMRRVEVELEDNTYLRTEDYILGGEALELMISSRKKAQQ